ncbi:MAG: GFA family protein [Rickettsiales bacterium]|jgi:hypothetical protein
MKTYHGSCHCGTVKYEIEADLSTVTRCTCSICTKKGILLARVAPDKITITEGADALKLYQFNEMVAEHYFCPNCGIHTHGHPRAAPEMFVVNVNTLDDFDVHAETFTIRHFDGRHWEQAFAESQGRGR